ncbi:ShlB/FhaC/HecB family hemolysin secretion/activation protein [Rhodocyclus purpureus]|uniref:ShlB/FhaC/HecB family hemolysin secretion/activation protein n=1 Tax=Rhodocyclus purpureus TaxID=1067 RepID=UPI0019112A7A|nr:ShlB/FhaC/HecB family hemolysin secretion/activation protein [Rhodocyclus purpureus]MBK5915002.1 hypothetical protein [Rhodocyclus purpureus]
MNSSSLHESGGPSSALHRLQGCCAMLLVYTLFPATTAFGQQSVQPTSFPVKSVRLEGNTLLPEASVAELLAGLAGEGRSLAELKQRAARVQEAYRDAGYGGVVTYLPEQSLSGGDVAIRVVEGKLAEVRVKGEGAHFTPENVRAGLPHLREGETPFVRAIDRDIQLSNENPAKELRVTLLAGRKPGDIDADIEVAEKNPLIFLANVDNTGNERTGNYRIGVGIQHANLFNSDHVGTAQFQSSPEEPDRVRIYSLGYRMPLYGWASSIDAFYAHSTVDTGTTATTAGPLSFSGKGTVVGLRANRYLDRLGEYDHRLTLGMDWRKYDNSCSLGDFGAIGCGPAAADIRIAPLSMTYVGQQQTARSAWGFNVTLLNNIGGSSQEEFAAARPGAARDYLIGKLSAFAEIPFGDGYALHGRVSAQYSADALVPGEQFGLGGAASVRGYSERELAGDHGHFLSLEALGPDFAMAPGTGGLRLRPLVFLDQGSVANHQDKPCRGVDEQSCSLSSIGFGFRLTAGKSTSARLDIGRALEDGIIHSAGRTRGHLSVNIAY